jgi:hypothetical protein
MSFLADEQLRRRRARMEQRDPAVLRSQNQRRLFAQDRAMFARDPQVTNAQLTLQRRKKAAEMQPKAQATGLTPQQTQAGIMGAATAGAALQSASGGEGTGGVIGSTLSGAATGASFGAMSMNPYGVAIGAAIGAGVGLVKGISGSSSKRKARRRAAMARKFEAISRIKENEGFRKQQALQNIMDGLRGAFIRGK